MIRSYDSAWRSDMMTWLPRPQVMSLSMHAKIDDIISLVDRCDAGEVTHNAFP